jgi:N-acetylglucosamine-6-sulfatase
MRRYFWQLFAVTIVFLTGCSDDGNPASGDQPPNVLLIITDDQRYDTMDYMPRTQARIFDQGVTFSSAFATTPLCCPSRASVLTGQYAYHHRVRTNYSRLEQRTFVRVLHDAGYFTGLVGKYLNSYPLSANDKPRREFDFWVAHGSLRGDDYYGNPLNVQGEVVEPTEHLTTVTRDYALAFLDQAAQRDPRQPFLLIYALHAPHDPAVPVPGDENVYLDATPYRPPSFNEADVLDKPRLIAEQPLFSPEEIIALDESRLHHLQSLKGADDAIGMLLDKLEQQGQLDNTMIIYMSDNGIMWGEHRVLEKELLYEEAVHIPFAIRYPALVAEPFEDTHLVANIDIAPTLYDLLNLTSPDQMDGMSLLPLLSGEVITWRTDLLLEVWKPDVNLVYRGIRTERYVYMEAFTQEGVQVSSEFYDLEADPYQIENRIDDPGYAELVHEIATLLPTDRSPWYGYIEMPED